MPEIVCYVPTYSPFVEADAEFPRPYERLSQELIAQRIESTNSRRKPWVYLDAIDSIRNIRPDIKLVVADGRSTESVRDGLKKHHGLDGGYELKLYPERMSQWDIFNDIFNQNKTADYFVYSSSDIIWQMDWISEAIKEFERNPKLMILFPYVNTGDANIPQQIAKGPRDMDPVKPSYDRFGKAPVLNAYAMIFRMDFLRVYGGYPNVFRNCFTESFLHYLCEAVGGELRLLPRGWCFHWGTVDYWEENGSNYYYNEEKPLFEQIMFNVQMRSGAGMLTKDYLKKTLWRENE